MKAKISFTACLLVLLTGVVASARTLMATDDDYVVDNTSVVGTWYAPDGVQLTFSANGITNYPGGATYKFHPMQGVLTVFNAQGFPIRDLVLNEVTPKYLLTVDYATDEFTYYVNQASLLTEISVSPSSITLDIGSTQQLTATSLPAEAFNHRVIWSSSDESIASVDNNGLVTAVAGGTCTITAAATDGSGVTATCEVTVLQPVTGITLNHTSLAMAPDEVLRLTATVLPTSATNRALTWTTSDENVAEVTNTGLVCAVGLGTCTITATAQDGSGVSAICTVIVVDPNTHDYVDLGLPSGTLWATTNIGAFSSEDYGDYFAWGYTLGYNDGNTTFTWDTYKYSNGSSTSMTKYCTDSNYGTVDNKLELELSDDAAYVNWGNDWCMPSKEQFEELVNSSNTTTEWITQNGVNGRRITSKTNGNSIFLPAAGTRLSTSLGEAGSRGSLWTRTLYTGYQGDAWFLDFESYYVQTVYDGDHNYGRCCGRSIRPVRLVRVSAIDLDQSSLSLNSGDNRQLTATITPTNATIQNVIWTSSNENVATVSNGAVYAVGAGACTITCTAMDDSGVSATCAVTVVANPVSHEFVDLGLPSGTLWATCNVGASLPEDYGDYFAWGETTPKSTYSWSTYRYCNGSNTTMTKYCTDSSSGTVDNKTELDILDDAAYVNWGSDWCMPSKEQIEELQNNATWEKTTQNGVAGVLITSNSNGNSIFMPAAGKISGTSYGDVDLCRYTWSRDLQSTWNAYVLNGYFSVNDISYFERCQGHTVRPVRLVVVTDITLNHSELTLYSGSAQQLIANITPTNATNKDVTWTSSNTNVAMVSSNGAVYAVGAGSCTITCTVLDSCGVSATCTVTVVSNLNPASHEYMDLGLPSGTLWATCNVGATNPEDYGGFFAWGETTPKSTYSWSTYKYGSSTTNLTKYNSNDGLTELETGDDAAYVNWGSDWRMPSQEEINELVNSNYTTTEWTTLNGVNGRLITSRSNGNSIFLPAAGMQGYSGYPYGESGLYWSKTKNSFYTEAAYVIRLYANGIYCSGVANADNRCYGLSVRPVRATKSPSIIVTGISLSPSSLTLNSGTTAQLTATITPTNATNRNVTWSSSNTSVATVSSNGTVFAVGAGTCIITCMTQDGSDISASCTVVVSNQYSPSGHTASVRGTSNLCSENWSFSDNPVEVMTYDSASGLWKITLRAKDTQLIEFKVVYDGDWYGQGQNGYNYQFQVTEPSDVLITFDPNTLVATYSGSKVVEYDPDHIDYIVAVGSSALLNGQDWKADAQVNKLTETMSDYYVLELHDVVAGTYSLKFTANGAWSKQWGGFDGSNTLSNGVAVPANGASVSENFNITLPKGAVYTVTLTLNNTDPDNPMVTAAWAASASAPIVPDVYSVAGTCNGWNQSDVSTEMTEVSAGVYRITIPMQAGEQSFRVVKNHSWEFAYPASNYVLELENDADVTITINMNENGNITVSTAYQH